MYVNCETGRVLNADVPRFCPQRATRASSANATTMDTAAGYVHSFVSSISSLFGAEPAPEPLPWYLEWWVFFGLYVLRIVWHVPLAPKVQAPRTRPALAAAQRLTVHHRQRPIAAR